MQDRAIQAAVMDAYRSLLMHGEYPFVVVWLDCSPDEIDVNIHPTKSQIKFQNASDAFKIVHSTLRKALEKAPWLGDYQKAAVVQSAPNITENLKFFDQSFVHTQFKNKDFNLTLPNITEHRGVSPKENNQIDRGYWSSLQVIGQLNLTYIVCQKEDRIVFVDQHAAHERVVYESLMKAWQANNFEVQNFLFPLAIDLSADKVEILLKYINEIQNLGFEIEQLGPEVIGIKSALI